MQLAIGGAIGKTMTEGAIQALPLRRVNGDFTDGVQDFLVAGAQVILG